MREIDLGRLDLNLLVTFEVLMTEGNVTRAAARLGRTQPAVSQALARLREQVGDPLLVKTSGGMTPSPFAQRLIEDVRPVLRTIQRIISPPEPFDPATSTRVFRAAIADFVPTLMPKVIAEVVRQAPGVAVEWLAPTTQTMTSVAEGQIDLTLVNSAVAIPEGVERQDTGEHNPVTFARKDHPAILSWGPAAWAQWPHIRVHVGERLKGEVDSAAEEHRLTRTIGAIVPNFSQIPSLLAQSNLLATMTPLVMDGAKEHYGLCALEPPIRIPPTRFSFVWSFRLTNDPGSLWFRTIVIDAYAQLLKNAERTTGRNLIKSRSHGPTHGAQSSEKAAVPAKVRAKAESGRKGA
jgi:DNA-binding transcriptional LysR family regulator